MTATPAELAHRWGASERRIRREARRLGCCSEIGRAMVLTDVQQARLLEALQCSPSTQRGRVQWMRGKVAGRRIHESTGTTDEKLAAEIKAERESREYKRRLYGPESVLTFAQAVAIYLDAGKSERFLAPLVRHFKDTTLREIKPGAITQAAVALYPRGSAATRNRQAIAPAAAVINHAAEAGLCPPIRVRRFKVQKTIRPFADLEWIEAFSDAAAPKLSALAWFMFLTGARIGSATKLRWEDVDLVAGSVIARKPKAAG